MAQTNYTPIQLYYSTTASAAPTAGNLLSGELAINITDGKLYYKDNGGTVQIIATKNTGTIGGSDTQVQFNDAGALAGSSGLTYNKTTTTLTVSTLNLTNALGTTYGGTGLTSYTTGDLIYSSASNTLSKLAIGTANYILTVNSGGTNVQWSAPSSISVSTATNLAGGAAGSVPYQSGASTTTFLSIGAANRVMTSSGSAPQWVTSLTGLTGVSSSSITNTSLTSGRVVYSTTGGAETDSANLTFDGTTLTTTGLSNSGTSALVKLVTVGNTSFNGTTVFAAATPAKLYMGTGTVTDTTSAVGATNAIGAVASLGITPIAATNTSVTYTDASTLYIAGAPSAGTNVTLTNPYALYIAAGNVYLGGGTASGVAYLNSNKVLTTGSALTFDGTNLGVGATATALSTYRGAEFAGTTTTTGGFLRMRSSNSSIISLDFTDVNGRAIFTTTNHPLRFGVNDNEQMRIGSATGGVGAVGIGYTTLTSVGDNGLAVLGNVGIGTSSPTTNLEIRATSPTVLVSNSATRYGYMQWENSGSQLRIGTDGAFGIRFDTNASQKMLLDTSGNLGLGVTSIATPSGSRRALQVSNSTSGGIIYLSNDGTESNNPRIFGSGTTQYDLGFAAGGSTGYINWYTNGAERARIDSGGSFALGAVNDGVTKSFTVYNGGGAEGTVYGTFTRTNGGSDSLRIQNANDYYANSANCAVALGRNSTNSRSINAGGTVNASGADYAEYMTKAGEFTIAKGDVIGIDAEGKLTNIFSNAISFAVKSTDPSYVGGDSWGAGFEEDPDGLEQARQRVDRIAFAGQVPVNVTGSTAGQYIIPVNDNGAIKGEAVSNPTFEQYQTAVGKVIAIESDGRARIIVKVA